MKNFLINLFIWIGFSLMVWVAVFGLINSAQAVEMPVEHGFYVGIGIGHGNTLANNQPAYKNIDVTRTQESTIGTGFAGYRFGYIAVESGAMYLPEYHATADTRDYPKYNGCAVGPTCPQTATITQDIFARAVYLRANLYTPKLGTFEGYTFVGRAIIYNYNHEYGNYNGIEMVDFKVSFTDQSLFSGFGVQSAAGKNMVRLEYMIIPSASTEAHTLVRNVSLTSLSFLRKF